MVDARVLLDGRGRERGRAGTSSLLPDAPLSEVLDTHSWEQLLDAIERAPVTALELLTRDGRVLDATIEPTDNGSGVAVVLRDVSRYAEAAVRLGGMAVELGRRNRDLRALHEATTELGATLDPEELCTATCRMVISYLEADAAQLEVPGRVTSWPADPPDRPADGERELATARGNLGTLQWWGGRALKPSEERTVGMLVERAAIGLDHALLLDAALQRADRDPLTGLLNRSGATRVLAGFRRPHAVMLIDLDHFKAINDRHGHAEGDRVLREVASILGRGRTNDVKARWGGEEFLVALEGAGVGDAVRWLEQRRQEVRRDIQVVGRPVTFSAGVALVRNTGLEPAIEAADGALYEAKDGGRDRVVVAPTARDTTGPDDPDLDAP